MIPTQRGPGWSATGCEEQTQAHPVPCAARETGIIMISRCMGVVCVRKRQTEWFISCGQSHIWRGESSENWADGLAWLCPGTIVISGPELLPKPKSVFMISITLSKPMLISMASDTIQGRENRAVQSWPCPITGYKTRKNWFWPSSAEALRIESFTSPGQHNRTKHVSQRHGKLALRVRE